MELTGVKAIVTGGGVVGGAIALGLAGQGADVAIVTLRSSQAETVAAIERIGRRAVHVHADITDRDSVDRMVGEVVEGLGGVDLLVNNAGLVLRAPLHEVTVEDWDRVTAVNLRGTFLCGVAVAKHMMAAGGGNIVNIAGATAHKCFPGGGGFGPAKAGVLNLTGQMAMEWARYGIRVNGVSPGPIMNQETAEILQDAEMQERVRKIPLGRVADAEEIASVVCFLASSDSSYITGHVIVVDGGGLHTSYLYP